MRYHFDWFCLGMKVMIAHLAESLENFQEEEHWKDEHFVWLNDFLSEADQRIVFFWNDFEDQALRVSNTAPPPFYGKYLRYSYLLLWYPRIMLQTSVEYNNHICPFLLLWLILQAFSLQSANACLVRALENINSFHTFAVTCENWVFSRIIQKLVDTSISELSRRLWIS